MALPLHRVLQIQVPVVVEVTTTGLVLLVAQV